MFSTDQRSADLWPDNDREVCSEFCCQLLQAGGLYGLDPFVTPPQELADLKIYSRYEQVIGTPTRIKKLDEAYYDQPGPFHQLVFHFINVGTPRLAWDMSPASTRSSTWNWSFRSWSV